MSLLNMITAFTNFTGNIKARIEALEAAVADINQNLPANAVIRSIPIVNGTSTYTIPGGYQVGKTLFYRSGAILEELNGNVMVFNDAMWMPPTTITATDGTTVTFTNPIESEGGTLFIYGVVPVA